MTFDTLDRDARIARFDRLAEAALAAFGVEYEQIDLLTDANNAVYKVSGGDETYTLRAHRPGHRRLSEIEAELAWLEALDREAGLRVPRPVAPVYTGELDGVDDPVYCSLLAWVPGRAYQPAEMSDSQLQAIGRTIARLHDVSQGFAMPDFDRPRLDYEGLFGEDSTYNPGDGAKLFTDEQRAVMDAVQHETAAVMGALGEGPAQFGLIHADLIAKNILFEGETVGLIDFDDCGQGYYLYDLSPMLWASREDARFPAIRDALWAGYTAVRPEAAPHKHTLDAFLAARHVASCRWVAGNASNPAIRGRAEDIIAVRVEEMRQFLQTGQLWSGR